MTRKILIVTDNLKTQINGVVTTFSNIEKLALADGYEVHFIDPSVVCHIDFPGYPEVKLSSPFIGKLIKKINPDYIHIATEGPLGLAAVIYCGIHNLRYNTSYHTKFPEYLKLTYGIPLFITYAYMKWFHSHSGIVLTTTKTMVEDLKNRGFKNNILPWTRGVDRDYLKASVSFEKSMTPVVLYVGRVSKEKGLDDLCKMQDKYTIQIVGDGPYRQHLEKTYKNVDFLGYLKGKDLANKFASADIFCFPSKTDTFGIVIIEALSQGTPVAAYPVPGPVDIIEQGINGYMSDDICYAIDKCLKLDRKVVLESSKKWTWEECWKIFKANLVCVR